MDRLLAAVASFVQVDGDGAAKVLSHGVDLFSLDIVPVGDHESFGSSLALMLDVVSDVAHASGPCCDYLHVDLVVCSLFQCLLTDILLFAVIT